ncbi:MAG: hypothetical protein ACHQF2_10175, partial [Flavobacteriales bacterium]
MVRKVTSLNDAGAGTLRAQILASSAGDVIVFGVRGTINLLSPVNINQPIEIKGATTLHTVVNLSSVTTGFGILLNPGVGAEVKISGIHLRGKTSIDGALHVQSGTLVMNDCLISSNVTTGPAGAVLVDAGAATKINNTSFFSNGTASGQGGAINSAGILNLTNCTFGLNGAVFGGAIYIFSGSCNLLNCTLNNNSASSAINGHAIYGNAGTITVQNTIITDPTLSGIVANNGATWTSYGGNLYRGASGGFFNSFGSDVFSAALAAGIQTNPITDGYGHRVYRLTAGSPARDIGTSPGIALNILSTDARFAPRIMDGDATPGSFIDAGAVEFTKFTVANNNGGLIPGSLTQAINDVN